MERTAGCRPFVVFLEYWMCIDMRLTGRALASVKLPAVELTLDLRIVSTHHMLAYMTSTNAKEANQ